MSEHIEYHRFPRGEACTYEGCPAKRYYIADGKRFCNHGHEQEGFRQIQQDEDNFNSQGRITRRKREEKEHVERVFSGREAAQLFLQCYQLVLWKQVKWLIDMKGLPDELETVVRDLWSVRLRGVKSLGVEDGGAGGRETVGFSSQSDWEGTGTETDGMESSGGPGRRHRRKSRQESMPRLVDSLALCYLGTLLMRLPITLGEFHHWAGQEDIIFVRAVGSYATLYLAPSIIKSLTEPFADQRNTEGNERQAASSLFCGAGVTISLETGCSP
jgi:RNA polymerase I-specific transcription initiation factor RRN7